MRKIHNDVGRYNISAFFLQTSTSMSANRHHMHKYFRSNAIYLYSLLLGDHEDDEKNATEFKKDFLEIDALQILILLIVAHSSLVFSEKDNRFHLGEQVND